MDNNMGKQTISKKDEVAKYIQLGFFKGVRKI